VRKKCYKGQDTIVYDSNLDRVPWVMSTVSCPQDSASCLPLAVLLIKSSYLLKVSCCLRPIINVVIFPAILHSAKYRYFLDWPIREILSLCFLPNNRTKVSLFCYSARYRYPYFRYKSRWQTPVIAYLRFRT